MKCSQCGREVSAEELETNGGICSECAKKAAEISSEEKPQDEASQEEKPQEKKAKSRKGILIAAVILVIVLIAAGVIFSMKQTGNQDGSDHINPTSAISISDEKVSLCKDGKTIDLYRSNLEKKEEKKMISKLFQSLPNYVTTQNYTELKNGEIFYIPLTINSMADISSSLCTLDADGNEKVIDENAVILYSSSDTAVYYVSNHDGKIEPMRYMDGELTPTSELFGEENLTVSQASDDNSLLQVVKLENNQATASGYFYNDKLHMMEDGYHVVDISKNGKEIFVSKIDEKTQMIDLFRVKDMETGELEQIGSQTSETIIYDNGSLAFIGDCTVSEEHKNPIGNVYVYDSASGKTVKAAEQAVTLMEAQIRPNGWMNENGRDMMTTEMIQGFKNDKTLYEGQIHYIDKAGNLCVVPVSGEPAVGDSTPSGKVIAENFYDVENYNFQGDIAFTTATADYLYWAKGNQLFRYTLGSMQDPQIMPLNESIEEKVQNESAQIGYMVSGHGDIVEETENKLILKKFDEEETVPVLENVGLLRILGMDNAGENIYFLSENGSLYWKSIEKRSNPQLVSPEVLKAVAAEDGLYYMALLENDVYAAVVGESAAEDENIPEKHYQYNLMHLEYGKSKPTLIAEDVTDLNASYIMK